MDQSKNAMSRYFAYFPDFLTFPYAMSIHIEVTNISEVSLQWFVSNAALNLICQALECW
jgi:hypothetical protein